MVKPRAWGGDGGVDFSVDEAAVFWGDHLQPGGAFEEEVGSAEEIEIQDTGGDVEGAGEDAASGWDDLGRGVPLDVE